MTVGNSAQLERDLKGLRELWRKRSKKLDTDPLCKQLRLHLNRLARGDDNIPQRLENVWEARSSEADRRSCGSARKRRSDLGSMHVRAKRRLASHLTEGDKEQLADALVETAPILPVR